MSFLCWLLAGLLSASIATRFLEQKRYLLSGVLFGAVTLSSVAAGWGATQLGWDWGDAVQFNYRSVLLAGTDSLVTAVVLLVLLNLKYPAPKDEGLSAMA